MVARVMIVSVLALAPAWLVARPAAADAPNPPAGRASLVGTVPPEIAAPAADWHVGLPATLGKLKGAVVWLQFNF